MKNLLLPISIILSWMLIGMFAFLDTAPAAEVSGFVPDEVLIQFKSGVQFPREGKGPLSVQGMNLKVVQSFAKNNILVAKKQSELGVGEMVRRLRRMEQVVHAEPNYYRQAFAVQPNDPFFAQQWALQKIQADQAWPQTTGSSGVIVGVADSGIDYLHEDLIANLWQNQDEICNNGIDDDSDEYVDNCFGINTVNGIGDPDDDVGHGTRVSGIIGAVGNNQIGVSGVNWQTSLMALKFMDADGKGTVSDLIQAIEFAMDNNVRVVNMSFGSYNFSQFEKQAIQNAGHILFVAAAGNESGNNDISPLYPAGYDLPNIVSVAASNESDSLAHFSNYGSLSVDLAGPGTSILSTTLMDSYGVSSGTSMSTAVVTGVAALVLSADNSLSAAQIKDRILRTVDGIPALQDQVITGGRVNASKALSTSEQGPYIFKLAPEKAGVGAEVTILGVSFLDVPGSVFFTDDLQAPVDLWTNHKIVCRVPEGAESGSVQVQSDDGAWSNEVQFELSTDPDTRRISFAHASCRAEDHYFLILSNVSDQTIQIHTRGVGSEGDVIIKIITLQPYANKVIRVADFGIQDDNMMINLESESFFGAYLLTFSRNGKEIFPMYPNPWGPDALYDDRMTELYQ